MRLIHLAGAPVHPLRPLIAGLVSDFHRRDYPADAEFLPRVLTSLMRDIGIPNGIGAAGYASGGIPALAGATLKQRRLLASCPRPVTGDDLGRIFKRSLELC